MIDFNCLSIKCPVSLDQYNSIESWIDSIGKDSVVYSCASRTKELKNHFRGKIELNLYHNFNDNPLIELDIYDRAQMLTEPMIAALAEIDLERATRINDKLGVTQGASHRVGYFRDKYKMKSLARDKGASVPPMSRIQNALELVNFTEQYGYPVVVKPCDGRGSNGVEILRDKEQLRKYLRTFGTTKFFNLMVEQFVKGEHYQINGLVINSNPIVISTSKALVSCLDFLSGEALGLQMVDPNSPLAKEIKEYAEWLVFEVLPSEKTFLFHLEIFVTEKGEIILGEIASRLGGCFVNEELKAAWGLDLRMSYLSALRNPKQELPITNTHKNLVGQLLIPPKKGVLLSAPEVCNLDYVLNYKLTASQSQNFTSMSFTNGEIMSAIIKGQTEPEVRDNLSSLNHWFHKKCKWKVETNPI